MNTPESYGFPEPPVEPDTLIRNDLEDYMDGCVNILIIIAGVVTAITKKRTTILSILEENDTGQGDDLTLSIKLPAEIWPDDIDFAPGYKYALVLARVKE